MSTAAALADIGETVVDIFTVTADITGACNVTDVPAVEMASGLPTGGGAECSIRSAPGDGAAIIQIISDACATTAVNCATITVVPIAHGAELTTAFNIQIYADQLRSAYPI